MNESEMPDWMQMLRRVFGPEKAEEMAEKMRSGQPFTAFNQGEGVFAFPLQALLGADKGVVNWDLARMTATGKIGSSHRTVTHADAQQIRAFLSEANLRLDAATTLTPPAANYAAWSPAKWLEESLEVWQVLISPVAQSTTASMSQALIARIDPEDVRVEFDEVPPQIQGLLSMFTSSADGSFSLDKLVGVLSANLFALQFGQAWGQMARECFGSTDIGLPLGKADQSALIVENVEKFAQDAEVDTQAALTFLATREAAYVRLYHAVPWLRMYVTKTITDYAKDISFDLESMEKAMESINPMEPGAMEQMLGRGALTPQVTDRQTEARQHLETILAVMEGWVDMVVTRCLGGVLPELAPLREMMARRRATGGPAETTFASLIGLELRPKRLREASRLWTRLVGKLGPQGAEKIWEHPDLLPEESDFDAIDDFVARLAGETPIDEVEAALEAMLDGSLPYAKGLEPGADSEGDATAGAQPTADNVGNAGTSDKGTQSQEDADASPLDPQDSQDDTQGPAETNS